jgi:hypothetical protein
MNNFVRTAISAVISAAVTVPVTIGVSAGIGRLVEPPKAFTEQRGDTFQIQVIDSPGARVSVDLSSIPQADRQSLLLSIIRGVSATGTMPVTPDVFLDRVKDKTAESLMQIQLAAQQAPEDDVNAQEEAKSNAIDDIRIETMKAELKQFVILLVSHILFGLLSFAVLFRLATRLLECSSARRR